MRKSIKGVFFSITFILLSCTHNPITEDSIHIKFPLYIDLNKIPSGWTLDDHFGYALLNPNVKKIFINDIALEGNFDLTVYTNEPLKRNKKDYDFKGVSIRIDQTSASEILDVLLNQNIPIYEVQQDGIIEWIDLNNDVQYYYSSEDSVFSFFYLVPSTSNAKNRRNRLKQR